jgi:hypothetical protein
LLPLWAGSLLPSRCTQPWRLSALPTGRGLMAGGGVRSVGARVPCGGSKLPDKSGSKQSAQRTPAPKRPGSLQWAGSVIPAARLSAGSFYLNSRPRIARLRKTIRTHPLSAPFLAPPHRRVKRRVCGTPSSAPGVDVPILLPYTGDNGQSCRSSQNARKGRTA